jgi:hypothetical protein
MARLERVAVPPVSVARIGVDFGVRQSSYW